MSLRNYKKPVSEDFRKKVQSVIMGMSSNFQALRSHPLVSNHDASLDSVASFEQIINRSLPALESERWISATIQYLANVSRGNFLSFMFKAHLGSISQLVDGKLVATALGVEDLNIYIGEDGMYHVSDAGAGPRDAGAGPRSHDGARRRDGPRSDSGDRDSARRKPRRGEYKDSRDRVRRDKPQPAPNGAKPTMSAELYNEVLSALPDDDEGSEDPSMNGQSQSEESPSIAAEEKDHPNGEKSVPAVKTTSYKDAVLSVPKSPAQAPKKIEKYEDLPSIGGVRWAEVSDDDTDEAAPTPVPLSKPPPRTSARDSSARDSSARDGGARSKRPESSRGRGSRGRPRGEKPSRAEKPPRRGKKDTAVATTKVIVSESKKVPKGTSPPPENVADTSNAFDDLLGLDDT